MRLIVDPPAAGSWNMAVDEMLLESVSPGSPLTLRLYQWSPATLSLGYFQSHRERLARPEIAKVPWVRRPSGGGAIVHDREITYSLVVPPGHPLLHDSESLYRRVHESLRTVLASQEIKAQLASTPSAEATAEKPFLCFARRAVGDLLIGQIKVAGSAQRKKRGAVLQHGSILLQASPAAPELLGLEDLSSRPLEGTALAREFSAVLAGEFQEDRRREPLSSTEMARAAEFQRDVFESRQWNERR